MSVTETIKEAVGLGGDASNSKNTSADHLALMLSHVAAASREDMSAAKLPLAYRDSCAHLLIPLNKCRQKTYYLPWRCEDERHSYEKCQYEEFKKRVAKMDEIREAKGGARSN